MCEALVPVSLVLGSHLESLLSQLTGGRGLYIGSKEEEEEEVYVHEMCAALVPVSLVLGSHLECLVSELTMKRGLYRK